MDSHHRCDPRRTRCRRRRPLVHRGDRGVEPVLIGGARRRGRQARRADDHVDGPTRLAEAPQAPRRLSQARRLATGAPAVRARARPRADPVGHEPHAHALVPLRPARPLRAHRRLPRARRLPHGPVHRPQHRQPVHVADADARRQPPGPEHRLAPRPRGLVDGRATSSPSGWRSAARSVPCCPTWPTPSGSRPPRRCCRASTTRRRARWPRVRSTATMPGSRWARPR